MSRRIRFLAFTLLASFALGTAACASPTAPQPICEDVPGADTCPNYGHMGSGT